jgi:hypothetical protein
MRVTVRGRECNLKPDIYDVVIVIVVDYRVMFLSSCMLNEMCFFFDLGHRIGVFGTLEEISIRLQMHLKLSSNLSAFLTCDFVKIHKRGNELVVGGGRSLLH